MSGLRLLPIPALSDNYIWMLVDHAGNALVVDPGEAAPVFAILDREHLRLRGIMLTHHHPDHIGGVSGLRDGSDISVYAPHDARIEVATHRVDDGDSIEFPFPRCSFSVIAVPGHTSSHIAYYGHDLLFSGDTMFSMGCGRLFEGTPQQMLSSLDRLKALPGLTQVCCGHEYTIANCAFAQTVEPNNLALREHTDAVRALRAAGKPSVPSLLVNEIACNPFLRIDSAEIIASLSGELPANASRVERFAALRRMKDSFRA